VLSLRFCPESMSCPYHFVLHSVIYKLKRLPTQLPAQSAPGLVDSLDAERVTARNGTIRAGNRITLSRAASRVFGVLP
jgi:hypothetical protein